MAGCVEGIRRALVLGLVLIAGTAIEQSPSVGPPIIIIIILIRKNNYIYTLHNIQHLNTNYEFLFLNLNLKYNIILLYNSKSNSALCVRVLWFLYFTFQ